jgi:hypothetical protein
MELHFNLGYLDHDKKCAREVGRQPGIRYVLEGGICREAQRVHVTAQSRVTKNLKYYRDLTRDGIPDRLRQAVTDMAA